MNFSMLFRPKPKGLHEVTLPFTRGEEAIALLREAKKFSSLEDSAIDIDTSEAKFYFSDADDAVVFRLKV